MLDKNYIKYLEAVVISLLDERNDDRKELASTVIDDPCFTPDITFDVMETRKLIARQKVERCEPPRHS